MNLSLKEQCKKYKKLLQYDFWTETNCFRFKKSCLLQHSCHSWHFHPSFHQVKLYCAIKICLCHRTKKIMCNLNSTSLVLFFKVGSFRLFYSIFSKSNTITVISDATYSCKRHHLLHQTQQEDFFNQERFLGNPGNLTRLSMWFY